jgi:hypothetical protein
VTVDGRRHRQRSVPVVSLVMVRRWDCAGESARLRDCRGPIRAPVGLRRTGGCGCCHPLVWDGWPECWRHLVDGSACADAKTWQRLIGLAAVGRMDRPCDGPSDTGGGSDG